LSVLKCVLDLDFDCVVDVVVVERAFESVCGVFDGGVVFLVGVGVEVDGGVWVVGCYFGGDGSFFFVFFNELCFVVLGGFGFDLVEDFLLVAC